jgi:hypothetical protein
LISSQQSGLSSFSQNLFNVKVTKDATGREITAENTEAAEKENKSLNCDLKILCALRVLCGETYFATLASFAVNPVPSTI